MKLYQIYENEYAGLEDTDEFEADEFELIPTEYDPLVIGPYTFYVTDYSYPNDRTIESTDINVEGKTCHNEPINHLKSWELKKIAQTLEPYTGISMRVTDDEIPLHEPVSLTYNLESRIHDAVWELASTKHWDARRDQLL